MRVAAPPLDSVMCAVTCGHINDVLTNIDTTDGAV